jgi:hypothetical protein
VPPLLGRMVDATPLVFGLGSKSRRPDTSIAEMPVEIFFKSK